MAGNSSNAVATRGLRLQGGWELLGGLVGLVRSGDLARFRVLVLELLWIAVRDFPPKRNPAPWEAAGAAVNLVEQAGSKIIAHLKPPG